MISAIDLLSALLAFIILLVALKVITKLRQGDILKNRLNDLMEYKETLMQKRINPRSIIEEEQDKSLTAISHIIDKIQSMGKDEKEKLRNLFVKAGLDPKRAHIIYGISKLGLLVVPTLIAVLVSIYILEWPLMYKLLLIIVTALGGSYGVDFILRKLVDLRQERIRKVFPDALDLMVICAEAGLSLTATVQRVAREINQICPDLGYELALLSIELNMFSDREKALQNFSDRLDSPNFKAIIANIIQAEHYGTPIAQTMRVVAEQFRKDRLIEAEERAAKLPVLMTLPMMTLIFPCIYLIILGPAIIKVIENYQQ